ncbi:hypothetical protein HELRODRAFT_172664 [Helobdella robusta]|uniref:PiggyBac transposable element-derived protein 4 C-terminal zinc-ribbon domain-containing protein n=1 Tax=Helobdella robusta TaxID=6412 RepID=T1F5R5_HELRO|nr:hypothetical protein HELRODRAFT_172664 [Helobdella robusta]ESO04308.1 hypothetical protein HELRODRAFT_172664 [Helobdella robusta]
MARKYIKELKIERLFSEVKTRTTTSQLQCSQLPRGATGDQKASNGNKPLRDQHQKNQSDVKNMDPKSFYGTKTFQKLEEALEEIESDNFETVGSVDLCVLPPDLDELTDAEEIDDDNIIDPHYVPKDISGTIQISVDLNNEPDNENEPDQISEVRGYLRDGAASRASRKRKTGSSIETTVGFHFPGKLEKQLKCTFCHMKARWMCKKCGKTLCIEKGCFEKYHLASA